MIMRCRFGEGMNDSSANFHATNEASDLHLHRGYHRERSLGYESGSLVPTLLPNICAEVDAMNGWFDPDEDRSGGSWEQAGGVIKQLVLWACQAGSGRPRHASSIGRRVIALGFALAPGEIGWSSMEQAARELRCTKQSISKYSREILALAHGRYQRGGMFRGPSARASKSRASLRQWDGRRMSPEQKRQKRLAYGRRTRQEQSPSLEGITETPADHTSPAA